MATSENLPRCATCATPGTGRYCAHCGEKSFGPEDRTVGHFVRHGLAAVTNADGKIFLTLRTLLLHPGRLTTDYLRGRRKPYIAPLSLFLLANLTFFLLHPLIGSNTLTTDLNTHLHYTWHRGVAEAMVAPRLVRRGVSAETYAAAFDLMSVTQAKSLFVLVVPIFSLAVVMLYWRRRRNYAAHLVFATHFAAFWLLLICGVLALTNLVVRLLRYGHVFPSSDQVMGLVTAFTLAIMAGYLFGAVRVAFTGQPVWASALKALLLGIAFDVSLQAYRCVLFFITFWST